MKCPNRGKPQGLKDLKERILTFIACRGAVKASQELSLPEVDALLRESRRRALFVELPSREARFHPAHIPGTGEVIQAVPVKEPWQKRRCRPKIVIILGPTGTGKTDLSLKLAPELDAEIMSADSMQVYRFMDIGTAKPSPEERARVHTTSLTSWIPTSSSTRHALPGRQVRSSGASAPRAGTVLVVGGTGLYIRALTGGLIDGPSPDRELRRSPEGGTEEIRCGPSPRKAEGTGRDGRETDRRE